MVVVLVDTVKKDERKMLRLTYLLCLVGFTNLALLKQPVDIGAFIMALVMCILIGYSYLVITKFFSDGDKYIFIFASLLSLIGIIMLYRLDMASSIKQVIWFILGVTCFILIVVLLPNLKRFAKLKYLYFALTIIFMSLATLKGTMRYGSKNWVYIGGMGFQPSEFGKVFLILYLSSALKNYKKFTQLIKPALVVLMSLGFMVLQKDLGSALIIFGIAITILYIATSKLKYVLTCTVLASGGAYFCYKLFPHIQKRVMIWQHPFPMTDSSYQIVQSMFSIASGGLFGSGLGMGHPEFVPVRTSDFIFSAICEELGIVMGFAIIIISFLLVYRCMRAAVYVQDNFSRLISVGISAMLASQTIVIIGGVTNMIPLTGLTLPLVAYGGSSMIITFISLGLVQKISEGE